MSDTSNNAGQYGEGNDEIDLVELFLVFWRRKWTIAAFAIFGAMLGLFMIFTTPKTYQSNALVQLESRGSQFGIPREMLALTDSTSEAATEIEIIKSRLVLGEAVASLRLDWIAEPKLMPVIGVAVRRFDLEIPGERFAQYARRDEEISLGLLQVGPSWLNEEISLTKMGEETYRILTPDGQMHTGTIGETLRIEDKNFALIVDLLKGQIGRSFVIKQRDEISTLENVRANLSVAEATRGSGILELTYKSENADDATRILNAIAQSYVRQNIARGVANADSGLEFLSGQLPIAEQAVRDSEAELDQYQKQTQVVDLSFESQAVLSQIEKITLELQSLQIQEDEIKQRYTPNHPVYRQLLDNRTRLEDVLASLRAETDSLPETQRSIVNLTQKLELAQKTYNELLAQVQATRVVRASNVGSVRIVDLAQAGSRPIAPRSSMILLLATMLGFLFGAAWVLLRKWMRKGIQSSAEIEGLGLPVLATVNYVKEADTRVGRKTKNFSILAISDGENIAVEAIRSLRTSLHFSMMDAKSKTLAITSSAPSAGKSFVSTNLAATIAQSGKRVCLIDADLRRGQLRKFFGVQRNQAGLSDYLSDDKELPEIIQSGPLENLSVILTGRYPPNPAELLSRPKFKGLLDQLNKDFDLVIIDTPPVLAVTDATIIGAHSGAVLVVARHDLTPVSEIEAVLQSLKLAGIKATGAILNGFDPKKFKGSQYNYNYRYSYKSQQ